MKVLGSIQVLPPHFSCFCLLPVLFFVFILTTGNPVRAQISEGIQMEFPTKDNMFTVVFFPRTMLDSAKGDDGHSKEFIELCRDNLGIDFKKLERISVQFGSDLELGGERDGTFLIVAKYDEKIDADAIVENMFSFFEFERSEHELGKVYTSSNNGPRLLHADDRLLMSTHSRLEALLDKKLEGSRSEILRKLDQECDLCGFLDFQNNREDVRERLDDFFDDAPFAGEAFVDALMGIKRGWYRFHLKEKRAFEAVFETESDDAANRLVEAIDESAEQFVDQIELSLETMRGMPAEFQDTSVPPIEAMITILKNLKPSAEGKTVTVLIERENGLVEPMQKILIGLNAVMKLAN